MLFLHYILIISENNVLRSHISPVDYLYLRQLNQC